MCEGLNVVFYLQVPCQETEADSKVKNQAEALIILAMTQHTIRVCFAGRRFNKIAIQGTPQMAVDNEANTLSGVHYYSKCNLPLF